MPQPPTVSDVPGSQIVKHGTPTATFNLAGTLVAEDIQWSKGFASVDFPDHSGASQPGVIKSAAYGATKGVGSMTVQVKDANTVIFPGEFVTFAHVGFANLKFIVTNVGIAYTQNGATKIPIQMAEWLLESPLPQINTLDGDFSAKACGPVRFSRPIQQSDAFIYRQKFRQIRATWGQLALNTPGPIGGTYLVEETELEDAGVADVVTWDRVYSQKPASWNRPVSATKNYQLAQYVINGAGQTVDISIAGYTQVVKATEYNDYFLDGTSGSIYLPKVPTVSIIKYLTNGIQITDFGSGFPTDGTGRYTNNYAPNFIGGSIEPYMGKMVCLKSIIG